MYRASQTIFDSDNPRTWKSVCLKCNSARALRISRLSVSYVVVNACILYLWGPHRPGATGGIGGRGLGGGGGVTPPVTEASVGRTAILVGKQKFF